MSRPSSRTTLLWLVAVPMAGAVSVFPVGSYAVRLATAITAAVVLLRAADRHQDGLGRARRYFASSIFVGVAAGLASATYILVVGHPAAPGWLGDWIHLWYAPLAVIGVLCIPRAAGGRGGRLRELSDGAVAAGSLWYLTRVLLIDNQGLAGNLEGVGKAITLVYPLLPPFIAAMFLSAIPRVVPGGRPFLTRIAMGITVLGVAHASLGVVSWQESYQPTWWIAALNQVGLLLLLGAAQVGAMAAPVGRDTEAKADVDATSGLLVLGAPFAPLVLAMVAASLQLLAGHGITPAQTLPLLLVGVAVVVRHFTSARETGRLVDRLAARERAALHQARTDPLTGLDNRTAFLDHLDMVLGDPTAHPVAVALLDLNDFKDINDTHGHDTGDDVLRHTADRLRHAVPDGGIARLGGDEFAAFVRSSPDGGQALAAEIVDAFNEPIRVGRRSFHVRPSVGIVIDERPPGAAQPGDGSHLLAHADVAMYVAKGSKAAQQVPVTVLLGGARVSAAATIHMREEIGTPDLGQFRVEYQPIVDLHTGEIASAEALLRWRHPDFGEVSPATFIPLAERVGSVTLLGDHVLRLALDDLTTWSRAGSTLSVCVNMSPRQLTDPSLADSIVVLLAERGLGPDRLVLEVTEEALVDDIEAVVETIAALRAAGLSVAVDDFGTGYSSLRYLRRFDANIVKIDREFVQASATEPRTEALVRSVVLMADALDLVCVAEGIETLEQLALVRSHGCRLGQGFLLDPPMPAEALGHLLAAGHVYPVEVHAPPRQATTQTASVVPLRRAW